MEATAKIYELIPKIMEDIGPIAKGRRNQQQGYAFRGIDDMYHAFQPILAKYGVFVVPEVTEHLREERRSKSDSLLIYTILRVKHTFYAPDGSSVCAITSGEAMDSGDKSCNKAMSAAMKYALIEVFAVPTEGDNDSENQSPQPRPQAAKAQLKPLVDPALSEKRKIQLDELLDAKGFTDESVAVFIAAACTKYKVPYITDLPQKTWDSMVDAVNKNKIDPTTGKASK